MSNHLFNFFLNFFLWCIKYICVSVYTSLKNQTTIKNLIKLKNLLFESVNFQFTILCLIFLGVLNLFLFVWRGYCVLFCFRELLSEHY